MKHAIGVLITYHNEKKLLTECLDSVFSQTVRPDEIIVYDDFSQFPATDYIPKDYDVKVIRGTENKGPAYGRNYMLKVSTSEYIHFQDTDDLFFPAWCEKVHAAIESSGADVIFTEVSTFSGDRLLSECLLELKRLKDGMDPLRFAFGSSILTIASTLRREMAINIGGYRLREILPQSEDFDFHIRFLAAGSKHAEILEPLVIQRLRPTSHSSKDKILAWSSAAKSVALLSEELSPEYRSDLSETAAKFGSILYNLSAYKDAAIAYKLAQKLGPPKFIYRNPLFRVVAKVFGPLPAERLRVIYRWLLNGLFPAQEIKQP